MFYNDTKTGRFQKGHGRIRSAESYEKAGGKIRESLQKSERFRAWNESQRKVLVSRSAAQKNIEKNGIPFLGKKHTEESLKKMSLSRVGKCKGEKSPVWKGGKCKSTWRKYCLERDNFTCQTCGLRDKRVLTVDHVKSKALYPEIQFSLENGVTLCANCHSIKTYEDKELQKIFTASKPKRKLEKNP